MFRDLGMTEVALSVDAENPSGALQLYLGLGYRPVRSAVYYCKAMN